METDDEWKLSAFLTPLADGGQLERFLCWPTLSLGQKPLPLHHAISWPSVCPGQQVSALRSPDFLGFLNYSWEVGGEEPNHLYLESLTIKF